MKTILKLNSFSTRSKNSKKKRVKLNVDDISRQSIVYDNMVSAYAPVGNWRSSGVSDGRSAPRTEPV